MKKKKDDLNLDEDDVLEDDSIIDSSIGTTLESDSLSNDSLQNKPISDIDKEYIEIYEEGCPICGGEVKGNEYYKFFCKKCNIMFDRKDIMQDEFGMPKIRKTKLEPEEKEELNNKRNHLSQKIGEKFLGIKPENKISENEQQVNESSDNFQNNDFQNNSTDDNIQENDNNNFESLGSDDLSQIASVVDAQFSPSTSLDDQELIDESEEDTMVESGVISDNDSELDEELPLESREVVDETVDIINSREDIAPNDEDVEQVDLTESRIENQEPPSQEFIESNENSEEEYDLEEDTKIIASSNSKRIHTGNCHFIKKIHPENRIYYDEIQAGLNDGYELCVCLRRKIAKEKLDIHYPE